MPVPPPETLGELLADLHATRVATWAPEALKINVDQRRTLVATADRAGFVKAGDDLRDFTLPLAGGGETSLGALLETGPAVLVFFRFATCPACNIAIPYYARALWPALERLGASLTAISPQVPERLVDIKTRHDLAFNVASDPGNALGRRLGILYSYDEASRQSALAGGNFIGDVTGTGTWELPMPTVVVVGQDRVVRFADVSPDWLDRTEAEPVIAAVQALTQAKAA